MIAPVFFPPELVSQSEMEEAGGVALDTQTDHLRSLYFRRLHSETRDESLDRELVKLVIDHARRVIAHPGRPVVVKYDTFVRFPFGDLALEETIEESPLLADAEDYLVEYQVEKPFSCVAMLDCSSSMSGEKHLLASVAVAVLLLEVPPEDTSLTVFASNALTIKSLLVRESPEETILRFLRSSPRGFTNIYGGLKEGLSQYKRVGRAKRKVGLLATDGRTTEGGDPMEIARQFDFLVVLHLHGPGSHLEASKGMAQQGRGVCLEVEKFEQLPRKLYEALRMLARL